MKHPVFILLLVLAGLGMARAQQGEPQLPETGVIQRIVTRPGVAVPIYAVWRSDAVATLVLFSGGAGGYGKIGEDGWPASGNFLIRTGKLWAAQPFNVVMIGRPNDGMDLSLGQVRASELHAADNAALLRAIKQKSARPIWLVATSMGTISAAAAAIADRDGLVAGLVLTSSVTAWKIRGAVPAQNLDQIRVPTLIVHHAQDACWACRPDEAKNMASSLRNAPIRKTLLLTGGSGADGDPCGPFHHHGYIGMEAETVERIARWILAPGN